MRKAKQHLLISLAIFAVAFVSLAIVSVTGASATLKSMGEATKQSDVPETIKPVQVRKESPKLPSTDSNKRVESAPVAPEVVETHNQAPQATQAPQPKPKKLQGGHVPFTSKEVKPGDSESYVDTVGQCPFYEMSGPKGCVPPPDIKCNADWSECEYIGSGQWEN